MKCPNCGAEANSNICEYCGSAIDKPVQEQSSAPKGSAPITFHPPLRPNLTTTKKQIPAGCGWAIVIVVLICASVYSVASTIKTNPTKEINNPTKEISNSSQVTSISSSTIASTISSISTSTTTSTVIENQTFGLNQTAVFKDLKVTATELKESTGTQYIKPGDGKVFVGVKFTIENISDEDQTITSDILFDAYVDGVKCNSSYLAAASFPEGIISGKLSTGKKLVGWYTIEISKDWKELELQVESSWLSSSKATFIFDK